MTEAFNVHFTIEKTLARDIRLEKLTLNHSCRPLIIRFFKKTPSDDIVLHLLKKIDEKKATGLDKIHSKLLKMAPSLLHPH